MNGEKSDRAFGEAHLYAAVAKADGIVSSTERRKAGYYAEKSQDVMNVMGINNSVKQGVKEAVADILNKREFSSWTSEEHMDKSIELLTRAKKRGEPGIDMIVEKNSEGLYELALSDGYVIKEKRILDKIKDLEF